MQRYRRFLFVSFLVMCQQSVAQLTDSRKRELDSIATFLPKKDERNLDSVHAYLHRNGINDEERVWLFYGYLGVHFTYDHKRKNETKAPVFTPQYTAQRKKGVCRDYTRVFMFLCDKSGIKNLEVYGRTPMPLPEWVHRKWHREGTRTNHVWNIVYYNNAWHLMDPTWSHVESKEKFKRYNPKTKQYDSFTIKFSSRKYYDIDPKVMMQDHAPNHPAFLLSDSVPTFKTVRKKEHRQKMYITNYDFKQVLDSLSGFTYPKFTRYYEKACENYCKDNDLYYEYNYHLSIPSGKQARYFKPTLAYYDERIAFAKEITEYIRVHAQHHYDARYQQFETEILKARAKLAKKLAEEEKRKKKKTR